MLTPEQLDSIRRDVASCKLPVDYVKDEANTVSRKLFEWMLVNSGNSPNADQAALILEGALTQPQRAAFVLAVARLLPPPVTPKNRFRAFLERIKFW